MSQACAVIYVGGAPACHIGFGRGSRSRDEFFVEWNCNVEGSIATAQAVVFIMMWSLAWGTTRLSGRISWRSQSLAGVSEISAPISSAYKREP
jgi:hypothetical protein